MGGTTVKKKTAIISRDSNVNFRSFDASLLTYKSVICMNKTSLSPKKSAKKVTENMSSTKVKGLQEDNSDTEV